MRLVMTRLELPFFKQGDDIAQLLDSGQTNTAALMNYADRLRDAAERLVKVAKATHAQAVTVTADTHTIYVHGPENVIRPLIESGLLVEEKEEEDMQSPDEGRFDLGGQG